MAPSGSVTRLPIVPHYRTRLGTRLRATMDCQEPWKRKYFQTPPRLSRALQVSSWRSLVAFDRFMVMTRTALDDLAAGSSPVFWFVDSEPLVTVTSARCF